MIKLPEKENIHGAEDELDIAPEYSWVVVLIEKTQQYLFYYMIHLQIDTPHENECYQANISLKP